MNLVQIRVCGRYRLVELLQKNPLEQKVYLGINVQKDEFVLVKFEEAKNRAKQLLAEGKCLQSLQGGIGIPNMHWCGQDEDSSIIVTELLGKNLRELKEECGGRLSLKSVLMIADSLLDIIHYLHFKMLYLRTVTPELFSVGSAQKISLFFLNGFTHIRKVNEDDFEGGGRVSAFSSPFALRHFKYAYRDDLISLGLLLVFLLEGSLPWLKPQAESMQPAQNFGGLATEWTPASLCSGLPKQFARYFKHLISLKEHSKPDYSYLKGLFRQLYFSEGYEYDDVYDWLLLPTDLDQHLKLYAPISIDVIQNEEDFIREQIENAILEERNHPQTEQFYTQPHTESPGKHIQKKKSSKQKSKDCLIF